MTAHKHLAMQLFGITQSTYKILTQVYECLKLEKDQEIQRHNWKSNLTYLAKKVTGGIYIFYAHHIFLVL